MARRHQQCSQWPQTFAWENTQSVRQRSCQTTSLRRRVFPASCENFRPWLKLSCFYPCFLFRFPHFQPIHSDFKWSLNTNLDLVAPDLSDANLELNVTVIDDKNFIDLP